MHVPRKPEVMSPAGYWPQLRAAIEAGADAVYFGLKHFTARAKVGFDLSELPEVISLSERIVVLREGRVAGELSRKDATEDSVLRLMAGLGAS